MAIKKKGIVQPDPVIELNEIYSVKVTRNCLVLQKKISQDDSEKDEDLSKEEKTEGYRNLGFFSNWEYLGTILSRDIQRDKLLKKGKNSTDDFLQILQETYKEIQDIFKSIDKIIEKKK